MKNIEASIIKMVAEVLEIKEADIDPGKSFEEMGGDSIKFMTLLLQLDEIIDKDIDEILDGIDVSELKTINDFIILMKKQSE